MKARYLRALRNSLHLLAAQFLDVRRTGLSGVQAFFAPLAMLVQYLPDRASAYYLPLFDSYQRLQLGQCGIRLCCHLRPQPNLGCGIQAAGGAPVR